MKQNGFTLIEMLAIIVLLGVITLVAVPNITKETKKTEEVNISILNQKIENASKIYAAKYYSKQLVALAQKTNTEKITFTLNNLQDDQLINLKEEQCSNKRDSTIQIYLDNNKIKYDYSNLKDTDCYN